MSNIWNIFGWLFGGAIGGGSIGLAIGLSQSGSGGHSGGPKAPPFPGNNSKAAFPGLCGNDDEIVTDDCCGLGDDYNDGYDNGSFSGSLDGSNGRDGFNGRDSGGLKGEEDELMPNNQSDVAHVCHDGFDELHEGGMQYVNYELGEATVKPPPYNASIWFEGSVKFVTKLHKWLQGNNRNESKLCNPPPPPPRGP